MEPIFSSKTLQPIKVPDDYSVNITSKPHLLQLCLYLKGGHCHFALRHCMHSNGAIDDYALKKLSLVRN